MTSKNWSSKTGNILRRRLWVTALSAVVLLFALPVATAISLQNCRWMVEESITFYADSIASSVNGCLGSGNIAVNILLVGLAMLSALATFSYLFDKRQTDLLHSLPPRRGEWFGEHTLAGALMVLLPYLANLLLAVLVVCVMGFGSWLNVPALLHALL